MIDSPRRQLADVQRLIRAGEHREALAALETISPPPPSEGARAMLEGIAALRLGENTRAAAAFDRVPEESPMRRSWLAVARARRGDLRGAIGSLGPAGPIPYGPILVELAILIEGALLRRPELRPPSGVDPDLLRAMAAGDLTRAPRGRRLSWRRFSRAWTQRDFATLLDGASHLMRSQPQVPDGRYLLVHILLESGLTQEASDLSGLLCSEFPEDSHLQSQRGKVAARAGDLRTALDALRAVHVEGPEDYNCHWHLGMAALVARSEPEARAFFEKALRDYFIGSFEESWLPLWCAATSEHFLAHL